MNPGRQAARRGPRASPRGAVGRRARLALWAGLALACALGPARAAGPAPTEPEVKATFLFNFAKFTDWPPAAFVNAAAPLVIGVVGKDPFGRALEDALRGETVHNRPLRLQRLQAGDDPAACHVLFISRSEKDRLPALLERVKGRPVLTMSDVDRFCQQGGMINLVLSAAGTVQPEINSSAAREAGVQISSKLLSLPMVRLVGTER